MITLVGGAHPHFVWHGAFSACGRWRAWLGGWLVLMLVAAMVFMQARQVAEENVAAAKKSITTAQFWDSAFFLSPTTGNVFLRFYGYDIKRPDDWEVMLAAYTRGAYYLYPQRVYVNDPGQAVAMGHLAEPFPAFLPPPPWMAAQNITSVITASRQAGGETVIQHVKSVANPGTQITGVAGKEPALEVSSGLWMAAYLGVLAVAGYAIASLLCGPNLKSLPEIAGLSVLLGAAVVPWALLGFSLVAIRPSRMALGMILAGAVAGIVWAWRRGRLATPAWTMPHLPAGMAAVGLPFALLGAWVFMVLMRQTFNAPLIELDGFAIWGLKAKMLLAQPYFGLGDVLQDRSLSFSHLDYPLLLPFLTAGGYAAMGEVNDTVGKAPLLFLCLAFGLVFYAALRRVLPAMFACALAAVTLSAPEVIRWAVQGVADMPLAIFYAGGVIYLLRWMEDEQPGYLRICGCFCAACVLTKNEGLPLAFILMLAALLGCRRNGCWLREWSLGAAGITAVTLPWFLFRQTLPHSDENYLGQLTMPTLSANLERMPEIFRTILNSMFMDPNWVPFWWLVAAMVLAAFWRARCRATLALAFLLLAQLAVYVLAYVVSPYPVTTLLLETIDRLLLQMLPVGMLLVAYGTARLVSPREAIAASPISAHNALPLPPRPGEV